MLYTLTRCGLETVLSVLSGWIELVMHGGPTALGVFPRRAWQARSVWRHDMKWIMLFAALVLAGCEQPGVTPLGPQQVVIAVGQSGSIARSVDGGETWTVAKKVQLTDWSNINLKVSNLQVNGEINQGIIAQLQSVNASLNQLLNQGFVGDLYVKGKLYQQLGQQWTKVANNFGGAENVFCIASNGSGGFIAASLSGNISYSSDNGATWSALVAVAGAPAITGIATNGTGTWVIACQTTGKVFYSTNNGTTWTLATTFAATAGTVTVIFANGLFMFSAYTAGSVGFISTSPDGINWGATVNTGTTSNDPWLVYGYGIWLSQGDTGCFRSTNNGATWSSLISTGMDPYRGAFGNGVFVIGGNAGAIAYSTDFGLTWTSVSNPFGLNSVYSLSYIFGAFQAGSQNGLTARSYDNAKTWVQTTNPLGTNNVYAMASSPNAVIIAVGSAGSIATAGWNAVSLGPSAPLPQSAAGVGQELYISTATTGVALALTTTGAVGGTVLPGTWEYKGFWVDTGAYMRTPVTPTTGVAAGGTTIVSAQAGFYAAAYIWRVS